MTFNPESDTISPYDHMNRLLYLIIIIGVAFIGFYLGRSTGMENLAIEDVPSVNHEYPLPPPPPDSTPYFDEDVEDNGMSIILESPVESARIMGSFEVSGRARADMGKVSITLSGPGGDPIFGRLVSVISDPGDEYGRFSLNVSSMDIIGEVVLEVGFSSGENESGRVIRNIELVSQNTVEVEVFYNNSILDPWQSCTNVFPVKRNVSSDTNIYRAAIEALLEGPTENEKAEGFENSIPNNVKLKSVAADAEGTVTADFNSRLDKGVGGSCRVGAIRSQIETTLKQFPEVREVVISVEGEIDEALQP
jgi:hypothetical protein